MAQAIFILVLLASHEPLVMAERIKQHNMASTGKTPDKDWDGCKAFSKKACKAKTGCGMEKVWLDTPRQSCRFTEEYKLQTENIMKYFPTEIKRLEEKTVTFSKHGCLFGFFPMFKCHRRMLQTIRLFNYVRKARELVAQDTEHPAYDYVMGQGTKDRLERVASNLVTGFQKNPKTKNFGLDEGVMKMKQTPANLDAMKAEADKAGVELTEKDMAMREEAERTAAVLTMMGAEVTDESVNNLKAAMEASGEELQESQENDVGTGSDPIDILAKVTAKDLEDLDEDQRAELTAESEEAGSETEEDLTDPDDHELADPPATAGNSSALIQLDNMAPKKHGGPLKMLLWTGPKWLMKHGIGWIFFRIVWLVVFLITSVFSVIRAFALFPVGLIACVLWRALYWVGVDLLWEGDVSGDGFKAIGQCPAMMWDAVGFDTGNPKESAAGQIILQPARLAAHVSGVYHPYKSVGRPDPCKGIICGSHARCLSGQCYCSLGMYPVQGTPNCGMLVTTNRCVCRTAWASGFGPFENKFYGCNANNKCKVDVNMSSNSQTCVKAMSKARGWKDLALKTVTGIQSSKTDSCVYQRGSQQVPPLSIPSADKNGKMT